MSWRVVDEVLSESRHHQRHDLWSGFVFRGDVQDDLVHGRDLCACLGGDRDQDSDPFDGRRAHGRFDGSETFVGCSARFGGRRVRDVHQDCGGSGRFHVGLGGSAHSHGRRDDDALHQGSGRLRGILDVSRCSGSAHFDGNLVLCGCDPGFCGIRGLNSAHSGEIRLLSGCDLRVSLCSGHSDVTLDLGSEHFHGTRGSGSEHSHAIRDGSDRNLGSGRFHETRY